MNMNGYRIIPNNMLAEFNYEPAKKHVKKSWMSDTYHRRVQKKWLKRFGRREVRNVIMANGVIYAHPNTVEFIAKAVDSQVNNAIEKRVV